MLGQDMVGTSNALVDNLTLNALLQIITTDPDHIKVSQTAVYICKSLTYSQAILSTEFDTFEKGDIFRWYMESMLGTGVFNADGDMWKCVFFQVSICYTSHDELYSTDSIER
jgi:hypothetical protein